MIASGLLFLVGITAVSTPKGRGRLAREEQPKKPDRRPPFAFSNEEEVRAPRSCPRGTAHSWRGAHAGTEEGGSTSRGSIKLFCFR
jgi:hypothetical protein